MKTIRYKVPKRVKFSDIETVPVCFRWRVDPMIHNIVNGNIFTEIHEVPVKRGDIKAAVLWGKSHVKAFGIDGYKLVKIDFFNPVTK